MLVGGIHSLWFASSFMNTGYEFFDCFPAFFPASVPWLCTVLSPSPIIRKTQHIAHNTTHNTQHNTHTRSTHTYTHTHTHTHTKTQTHTRTHTHTHTHT